MNDVEARAQGLLETVRHAHDPTPEDRQRVRNAIAGVLVPGAAITGAESALTKVASHAASTSGTSLTITGKVLVSGTLIGATGLGAGYVVLEHESAESATPAAVVSAVAPRARSRQSAARASPAAKADPAEPEPVAEAETPDSELPRHDIQPGPALATRPRFDHSGSSLGEELALLRGAQQALRSDNAEQSLALLDQMATQHPDGALGEEAAAARVLALCRAGRQVEARARAVRFLHAYPSSVLASRVRSSCAFSSAPGNADASAKLDTKQTESSRREQ